ncbi:MAG: hypothetical protein LAT62_01600 [Natronospirillum sp.]|uniref:hypothetical protein n=1 Tax=Natronospirillum sp. TaxID=2812955 RepID=UPI0025FC0B51|nr:hypothetical protein [Natronospirillum sp.]MCH8550599.1 hypothetical protein [Natronospirillum sp.]
MRFITATLLATCLLLVAGPVFANWTIRGEAFDPDTGDLDYIELHYLTFEDDRIVERRVDYERPDGERFARKVLRYDTGLPYVPSLDWEDLEADTRITGRLNGGRYEQRILDPQRDETERARLSNPEQVVFDAAFDQYIADNFDQLLEQGRLDFDFLSLSAGRTYSFRIEESAQEDGRLVLDVGLSSALLRWFVDDLELEYDLESRRLLRFSGITNFRRDGDLVNSDIFYEYANDPEER